ncbi:MAG: hypothetical protein NVSMB14_02690 [Isosphaeraceae bacterium]
MTDESLDLEPLPFELSEEDHARIKPELAPGERVLWASRGRSRGLPFRGAYLAVAIVGLIAILLGFATMSWLTRSRFPVVGIISEPIAFVLLIGGLITLLVDFGTWIAEAGRLASLHRKLYVLTNRRALTWKPASPPGAFKCLAVHRGDYLNHERLLLPDGAEDLQLSYEMKFEGITNGVAVDRLARQVLENRMTEFRGLVQCMQEYLESTKGED